MQKLRSIFFTLTIACAISFGVTVSPAGAVPYTYDFAFSNAGVTASGSVTFNNTYINDPLAGFNPSFSGGYIDLLDLSTPVVLGLSVTVAGSATPAYNGIFTMSDFSGILLDTNGATLDFTQPLVGQSTPGGVSYDAGLWGPSSLGGGGVGDFNLFGIGNAPTIADQFQINLGGGSGELLALSSMAPVPEPSTILLLSAGLAGVGLLRKRLKRSA